MFWTLLIILGVLFGIGCFLGAAYATIRYGIPTVIWGIGQVFLGFRDAWVGSREEIKQWKIDNGYTRDVSQSQQPSKPFLQECREAWRQGWEDVRAKQQP